MREQENLLDGFGRGLGRHGDRIAIVTDTGIRISYRGLQTLVDGFAAILQQGGVGRGSHVILHQLGNAEALVCVLAAARLGAVSILAKVMLHQILATPQSKVVVATSRPAGVTAPVVLIDLERLAAHAGEPVASGFGSPEDIAVVVASSGSTGQRKFLSVTARQMGLIVRDQISMLPRALKRTLLVVPPYAIYGLQMSLAVLEQGGSILWPGRENMMARLRKGGVDTVVAAPLDYSLLVEQLRRETPSLPGLDFCVSAGSKISSALVRSIQDTLCSDIYNQYGSTELGPVAIGHAENLETHRDYSGHLQPWIDAWSVDETGARLPAGEAGRLVFALQAPRRISVPIESWALAGLPPGGEQVYVSEDFGAVTGDRCLLIESRVQERINIGGNKTTLQQVRQQIVQSTGITTALEVVSIQSERGFDEVVLFVAGAMEMYLPFLRRMRIPEIPSQLVTVRFMERLPQNEFGKPDFPRLREIAREAIKGKRLTLTTDGDLAE